MRPTILNPYYSDPNNWRFILGNTMALGKECVEEDEHAEQAAGEHAEGDEETAAEEKGHEIAVDDGTYSSQQS